MQTNSSQPLIDLDTIQGSRYSIEKLKPVLEKFIEIRDNKVSPELAEEIRKLLEGRQSNLVALKDGREARLMLINTPQGLIINPLTVKARLSLRETVMGYTLTENDKAALERHGHLGKQVLVKAEGAYKPFRALIGLDIENQKIMVLNVDKFILPNKILGVELTQADKDQLLMGHPIKKDNLINKAEKEGATFTGFIRINPVNGKFKYEMIKTGPSLSNSTAPSQPIEAENVSPTPLLDRLNLPTEPHQHRGKLEFPNGTIALVIAQKEFDNVVIKVTLPEDKTSPQMRQVFNLPLLVSRELAERVARLAQDLDRAIGQGKPLLPAFNNLPPYLAKSLPIPQVEQKFKPVRQATIQPPKGQSATPGVNKAATASPAKIAVPKPAEPEKSDELKSPSKRHRP